MKIRTVDENTWLFPDLEPKDGIPELFIARGGHTAVQIWTDAVASDCELSVSLPEGVSADWYQLIPNHVEQNSAPEVLTTLDYESCKGYVTRQAPFDVYDVTLPVRNPSHAVLKEGSPAAFFLRLYAAPCAGEGKYTIEISLRLNGESALVRLPLTVTHALVPSVKEGRVGVLNWLKFSDIALAHGVEEYSDAYWTLVERYMDSLLEIRSNHFVLPAGVPVRDGEGKVTGFDFTDCEEVGKRAAKKGFSYIYGNNIARFHVWNEPEIFLLWDNDTEVCSQEGFRQLKLYFKGLWDVVCRNGWQSIWMQCLVDEPQFANSMAYRVMAGICRQCMPGVIIHDPVESTELGGSLDIWCVKQAVFDKYRDVYKKLQAEGERLWVYTCGFPAGKWMNRSTDLPLAAGRLPFWMVALEEMEGFLHWGYNAWGGVNPYTNNCYPAEEVLLPPGDGFIVYPGENGPVFSVRAQGQLFAAEDCELLKQLPKEKRDALCLRLCRNFNDYESDTALFAEVRKELLLSF